MSLSHALDMVNIPLYLFICLLLAFQLKRSIDDHTLLNKKSILLQPVTSVWLTHREGGGWGVTCNRIAKARREIHYSKIVILQLFHVINIVPASILDKFIEMICMRHVDSGKKTC